MIEVNVVKVNRALVKGLRLAGAARRLIGKGMPGYVEIQDVEREIREAAAECQRVLGLVKEDANRPLLGSGKGG